MNFQIKISIYTEHPSFYMSIVNMSRRYQAKRKLVDSDGNELTYQCDSDSEIFNNDAFAANFRSSSTYIDEYGNVNNDSDGNATQSQAYEDGNDSDENKKLPTGDDVEAHVKAAVLAEKATAQQALATAVGKISLARLTGSVEESGDPAIHRGY